MLSSDRITAGSVAKIGIRKQLSRPEIAEGEQVEIHPSGRMKAEFLRGYQMMTHELRSFLFLSANALKEIVEIMEWPMRGLGGSLKPSCVILLWYTHV